MGARVVGAAGAEVGWWAKWGRRRGVVMGTGEAVLAARRLSQLQLQPQTASISILWRATAQCPQPPGRVKELAKADAAEAAAASAAAASAARADEDAAAGAAAAEPPLPPPRTLSELLRDLQVRRVVVGGWWLAVGGWRESGTRGKGEGERERGKGKGGSQDGWKSGIGQGQGGKGADSRMPAKGH